MRTLLLILILLIALVATSAGILLIYHPAETSLFYTQLSRIMPFNNPTTSGIMLLLIVSSTALLSFYCLCAKTANQYNWPIAVGILLISGTFIQVLVLQQLYWQHLVTSGLGLLMLLISYQLKGKWAV